MPPRIGKMSTGSSVLVVSSGLRLFTREIKYFSI
jgi:hypothetical protein